MNLLKRIRNKFFSHRFYSKDELTLEQKIEFLKLVNNPKWEFYERGGFCNQLTYYVEEKEISMSLDPCIHRIFPELYEYRPLLITYTVFGTYTYYFIRDLYWFPCTEKGHHERHKIANELLGILEEKQRKLNQ